MVLCCAFDRCLFVRCTLVLFSWRFAFIFTYSLVYLDWISLIKYLRHVFLVISRIHCFSFFCYRVLRKGGMMVGVLLLQLFLSSLLQVWN